MTKSLPDIYEITELVSTVFNENVDEIYGSKRFRNCVEARTCLTFMLIKYRQMRITHIARLFKKDHSTIIKYRDDFFDVCFTSESFADKCAIVDDVLREKYDTYKIKRSSNSKKNKSYETSPS